MLSSGRTLHSDLRRMHSCDVQRATRPLMAWKPWPRLQPVRSCSLWFLVISKCAASLLACGWFRRYIDSEQRSVPSPDVSHLSTQSDDEHQGSSTHHTRICQHHALFAKAACSQEICSLGLQHLVHHLCPFCSKLLSSCEALSQQTDQQLLHFCHLAAAFFVQLQGQAGAWRDSEALPRSSQPASSSPQRSAA